MSDAKRDFLRHTVATLAYRGGKVLRNAPENFPHLKLSETTRTPISILAHINDLLDWAVALARGDHTWNDSTPQSWDAEVSRFFTGLKAFDDALASDAPLGFLPEQLFQGPVADALTHVGQLAMLRRIAGSPVRGENYFKAEITTGRVGQNQAPPRREFN